MQIRTINIFGLNISVLNNDDLLEYISEAIKLTPGKCIAYANAHTLNGVYRNRSLKDCINSFDVIHPDGIGIFLASKLIHGEKGFEKRFTGSDFYPLLASKAIENKWKVFFFGHDDETLKKIAVRYPSLQIAGLEHGYNFDEANLLEKINGSSPDLLIIGFGFPKQEYWLNKFRDKMNARVSILVGDGIKVFAGTKKRGPKILRILGLEWTIRLILHPFMYFKRYIIGNPLFLYRIFKYKLSNLLKKQ